MKCRDPQGSTEISGENPIIAGLPPRHAAGAVATMAAARDAGLPQPAGAVVLSPWVDLTLGGQSMRTKEGIDPIFTREAVQAFATRYLAGQDSADPLASPVFADLRGLPPLLVQAGSNELPLDDAVRPAGRAGPRGTATRRA
ncbi:alpha/beta hydrolase fold domain-containing protein [Streptosporangium sandarakinum]|uniref:Acetyl esterase/lipase n=1 Tax=Streptosporangium sandarakinum TaxID=1260955 RepID=A0A852V3W1_9ACTN|nr:alpha/beta hydrolase fold domain-containing protein [Streptosporangium sandarakinum]NYF41904.1 acetyl esterase/lipase [Streptosporangium sandarakinum]